MVFKANQSITVRNTFDVTSQYEGWPNPMGGGGGWTDRLNQIMYILKTGLTWKGTIGKADIYITFHVPENYLELTGETALIACFKSSNERGKEVLKEVVQLLLKADADPEIRDLCDLNARDMAL